MDHRFETINHIITFDNELEINNNKSIYVILETMELDPKSIMI